jgi:hypothetical protein
MGLPAAGRQDVTNDDTVSVPLPDRLARLLPAGSSVRVERLIRWPRKDAPGRYVIQCSCERWARLGTAGEVIQASRRHDDAPWRNHVVTIYGRVTPTSTPPLTTAAPTGP